TKPRTAATVLVRVREIVHRAAVAVEPVDEDVLVVAPAALLLERDLDALVGLAPQGVRADEPGPHGRVGEWVREEEEVDDGVDGLLGDEVVALRERHGVTVRGAREPVVGEHVADDCAGGIRRLACVREAATVALDGEAVTTEDEGERSVVEHAGALDGAGAGDDLFGRAARVAGLAAPEEHGEPGQHHTRKQPHEPTPIRTGTRVSSQCSTRVPSVGVTSSNVIVIISMSSPSVGVTVTRTTSLPSS